MEDRSCEYCSEQMCSDKNTHEAQIAAGPCAGTLEYTGEKTRAQNEGKEENG